MAALLRRALLEHPGAGGPPAERLDRLLVDWSAEYRRRIGGVPLPAARQVEQRGRAVRAAVELAQPGR